MGAAVAGQRSGSLGLDSADKLLEKSFGSGGTPKSVGAGHGPSIGRQVQADWASGSVFESTLPKVPEGRLVPAACSARCATAPGQAPCTLISVCVALLKPPCLRQPLTPPPPPPPHPPTNHHHHHLPPPAPHPTTTHPAACLDRHPPFPPTAGCSCPTSTPRWGCGLRPGCLCVGFASRHGSLGGPGLCPLALPACSHHVPTAGCRKPATVRPSRPHARS